MVSSWGLHFETEGEAEGARQVLKKFFPEQIDLECTGMQDMRPLAPPGLDG
jgi:hypothetical protein